VPLVPGRTLVLALLLPLSLSVVSFFDRSFVSISLLMDFGIVLLAVVDALFVWRVQVRVNRKTPNTASLARSFTVDLRLQNLGSRPLRLLIEQDVPEGMRSSDLPLSIQLPSKEVKHAQFRLHALRRGTHALGAHYLRIQSPGGFWFRQKKLAGSDRIRVYPDVQAVRHYELLARQNRDVFSSRVTRQRGGDTEFERLRDYLPDDDYRRVDWKATARRQKLTVREFQLERNQNVMFMLDCGRSMTSVWHGMSALDHALNSILMMSHVAIRRGDQVGLIAFDEEVRRLVKPRSGISASNRIIQSVYDLFPARVESDYEKAIRAFRTQIRKRTLLIFITHILDSGTAARFQKLTRELLPQHLPLCVLLQDEEITNAAHRPSSDREGYCVQGSAAEILLWRHRQKLQMQRGGVMVLDCTPKDLTASLVSQYLQIKARALI
jgi:uncharacterized protein (DUF58 family)